MAARYDGIYYIAIPELQPSRGAIHYHLIWNITDMSSDDIQNCWKLGMVGHEKVHDEENLANYLCKDIRDTHKNEFQFKPQYLTSKGMARNVNINRRKFK